MNLLFCETIAILMGWMEILKSVRLCPLFHLSKKKKGHIDHVRSTNYVFKNQNFHVPNYIHLTSIDPTQKETALPPFNDQSFLHCFASAK